MRSDKQILKTVKRELEKYPGASVSVRQTRKHKELTLSYRGKTKKVFTSTSPSDARAVMNVIGDIRRVLKELNG